MKEDTENNGIHVTHFDERLALKQLLNALEYGKKKEEIFITNEIFRKFKLDRLNVNQLCNKILNDGPGFEQFFLEVMNELRPFTIMVQDIYHFFSYFQTTMELKASHFRVSRDKARQAFDFNIDNFPKELLRVLSETTAIHSLIKLRYGHDVVDIPNHLINRNHSTHSLWESINPRWDGDFYDDGFHRILSYAGNYIRTADTEFRIKVNNIVIPIIDRLKALTQPFTWDDFDSKFCPEQMITTFMNNKTEHLECHIYHPLSYWLDKEQAINYFATKIKSRYNTEQITIFDDVGWTLSSLAISISLWEHGNTRLDKNDWLSKRFGKPIDVINRDEYFNLLQNISVEYLSALNRLMFTEERSITKIHEQLIEFLNLPFWKDRWFLYELWTLCYVLNIAKDEWPIKLLQFETLPGGLLKWNLPAANSKHPVANIGVNGEIECWTQRKTFHPETKKGLEPDLRLSKSTPGHHDLIIVENKDRRKPGKGKMLEILDRYVTGSNAKLICLINYDKFTRPTHNLNQIFQDREIQVYSDFKPLSVPEQFIRSFLGIIRKEMKLSENSAIIPVLSKTNRGGNSNENKLGHIIATLIWSKGPMDLDLHAWIIRSNGAFHIYYNYRGSKDNCPYAELDTDARNLPGKETLFIDTKNLSIVIFAVHLFSSGSFSESNATFSITLNDGRSVNFELPQATSGEWWHICTLDESAKNLVISNRVNNIKPNII